MLQLKKIGQSAYRITTEQGRASMLTRYGFVQDELLRAYAACSAELTEQGVRFSAEKAVKEIAVQNVAGGGFEIKIPLAKKERLFGMGDANRDSVMIRGKTLNV